MSRKTSYSIIFRLKKKPGIGDLIDYDQAYLHSLSDDHLAYLAAFLQNHYESPGVKSWRSSRRSMADDASIYASDRFADESEEISEEPYSSDILSYS